MNYYLHDFGAFEQDPTTAQPPAFWRDAIDTYTVMARCFETMGCGPCQHYLRLGGGEPVQANMAVFEEMKACHDRRTGHRYAGGCCGDGAYLVEGVGVEMVETAGSAPRERFVFRDGSGVAGDRSGRSGSWSGAADGKTVYLPGSYVWGSRRSGGVGSAHGGRRSGRRMVYGRSEASGWLEPTARSERGVPPATSVAGSARSEGNTSSILPGESYSGYGERQRDRRRRGMEQR